MGVTYDKLRAYRESIGAPWFLEKFSLNLVIARSGKVGEWDNRAYLACVDETGQPIVLEVQCTGDAWEGEWTNPTHEDGCVYVLDGHYPGGYWLGAHKGRPALMQRTEFMNVRWPPGYACVPVVEELEALGKHDGFSDIRGTNWHNRWDWHTPGRPARDDSEGCTVSRYYHEHAAAMELVRMQERATGSIVVSPTFCRRSHLR